MCGLNSLVVGCNVKTHHIWKGNVITRSEIKPIIYVLQPRISRFIRRNDINEKKGLILWSSL